jgi:hypothetical protein
MPISTATYRTSRCAKRASARTGSAAPPVSVRVVACTGAVAASRVDASCPYHWPMSFHDRLADAAAGESQCTPRRPASVEELGMRGSSGIAGTSTSCHVSPDGGTAA